MERSFAKEVQLLKKGDGELFEGEGILAVTKAALQSGVSYVGGYQGSPVSHLVDVLNDAKDIMDEYGVHLEICANEAGAAAMLGASIQYPIRGLVTWKSTVGTNVASDALSNLGSVGVVGGAVVILGEDYGEGASIIQERSHAYALKSTLWLLDPRPNLTSIVNLTEKAFELSEASNQPVMVQLRILACHVQGRFEAKDNRHGEFSGNRKLEKPKFDLMKIALPPGTYAQEKHKWEKRLPAAIDFIRKEKLNEVFDGELSDIGIICQGGLYNTVQRALNHLGLADIYGNSRVPIYCMNVTYPLVADEISGFCAGKKHVLVVEEGHPAYIEDDVNVILRKADVQTKVHGKGPLPMAGQYTSDVVQTGVSKWIDEIGLPDTNREGAVARVKYIVGLKTKATKYLGSPIPPRPPTFCTGCPERPVFSAIKLMEKDLGKTHISCDIGCHTFSALPPFSIGQTVLGYGLGLASSTGIAPNFDKRVISIMGDGGFWHNGLTTGVASSVFNKNDSILIVMKNGYTSATGWQWVPSTPKEGNFDQSDMSIEETGARARRQVAAQGAHLRCLENGQDPETGDDHDPEGPEGHHRRERVHARQAAPGEGGADQLIREGRRAVRPRFGIDDDVCTGDHSLHPPVGCPSLTIKANPDPLRTDPIAHVNTGCVGCGLCGEVAHAAILCPSFYKADIVYNAGRFERWVAGMRQRFIGMLLQPGRAAPRPAPGRRDGAEDAAKAA